MFIHIDKENKLDIDTIVAIISTPRKKFRTEIIDCQNNIYKTPRTTKSVAKKLEGIITYDAAKV